MADLTVMTDPPTTIDYSIQDYRVRTFILMGEFLYDEDRCIDVPGWKDQLVKFVLDQNLHIDDGLGLHAFVKGLKNEGLI